MGEREKFKAMLEEAAKSGFKSDESGIRSIHIDFDKDILEINGEPVKRKTVVSLPASDGFYFQKGFNLDENNPQEEYDRLKVELNDTDSNQSDKVIVEVDAKFNSESLMSELAEVEEVIDRIISKVDILKATLSGIEPLSEGGIFIPEKR